jgi:putative transposase
LAGVARSSVSYRPRPVAAEEAVLRRRIDEIYTAHPCYGSPRITAALHQDGWPVNHKRVERLMRQMGLQALYPRRKRKPEALAHKIYPYLVIG